MEAISKERMELKVDFINNVMEANNLHDVVQVKTGSLQDIFYSLGCDNLNRSSIVMASKQKKPSGAENRKQKLQEQEMISRIPSITSFVTVNKNPMLPPTGDNFTQLNTVRE